MDVIKREYQLARALQKAIGQNTYRYYLRDYMKEQRVALAIDSSNYDGEGVDISFCRKPQDRFSNKRRVKKRLGRWLASLPGNTKAYFEEHRGNYIQQICRKVSLTTNRPKGTFHLLEKEDIRNAYGSFIGGGSCMTGEEGYEKLRIYSQNPDQVKLLVFIDHRNCMKSLEDCLGRSHCSSTKCKQGRSGCEAYWGDAGQCDRDFTARALVWFKDGQGHLDRVYPNCGTDVYGLLLREYAKEQGWHYRQSDSPPDSEVAFIDTKDPNKRITSLCIEIPTEEPESERETEDGLLWPYADSLRFAKCTLNKDKRPVRVLSLALTPKDNWATHYLGDTGGCLLSFNSCFICGEYHNLGTIRVHLANGGATREKICQDCLNAVAKKDNGTGFWFCHSCHALYPNDTKSKEHKGQRHCKACYSTLFGTCSACHKKVETNYLYNTSDGNNTRVCSQCEPKVQSCSHCGSSYLNEKGNLVKVGTYNSCYKCLRRCNSCGALVCREHQCHVCGSSDTAFHTDHLYIFDIGTPVLTAPSEQNDANAEETYQKIFQEHGWGQRGRYNAVLAMSGTGQVGRLSVRFANGDTTTLYTHQLRPFPTSAKLMAFTEGEVQKAIAPATSEAPTITQ